MLDGVQAFSQNLCPWMQQLTLEKLSSQEVAAMFTGTSCPIHDKVGFIKGEDGLTFTALCYNCTEFNAQATA